MTVKDKKARSQGKMLRIKLVRSLASNPQRQREVARGLGLGKLNSEVSREDCPEVRGMIGKIPHLVKVEVLEEK